MKLINKPGRKTPKTLSGIETLIQLGTNREGDQTLAGKHLKPYQGLKQVDRRSKPAHNQAGKHLKPYQGLKPSRKSEG